MLLVIQHDNALKSLHIIIAFNPSVYGIHGL